MIFFNRDLITLSQFDWLLTETDVEKLKELIDGQAESIYKYVKKKGLDKYKVYSNRNFEGLSKYGSHWAESVRKLFNADIGRRYNQMNSRDEIDRINSLNSEDKSRAIKKFMDDTEKTLKNII